MKNIFLLMGMSVLVASGANAIADCRIAVPNGIDHRSKIKKVLKAKGYSVTTNTTLEIPSITSQDGRGHMPSQDRFGNWGETTWEGTTVSYYEADSKYVSTSWGSIADFEANFPACPPQNIE